MTDILRTVSSGLLLLAGIFTVSVSVTGVMRFRFIMNRMHCAALLDSMALLLILAGAAVAAGRMEYVPKLILVLVFQWVGSPIASHMVGRLEVTTDDTIGEHMDFERPETGEDL